ncbi:heterokaryon incompatibility protein-domain-containing protein [Cadophora sp. MPI-SDFR-AT-0126]|nr:heterokaryon incompatibility protein-domain-containing protein [Leotiomycetes sp. MPI-SDFR-AT-0126]
MKLAYKYDPLPMNGLLTRIIRLKPAADPEVELQGEILVADLNTVKGPLLRYEAISYTWEGQSPSPNHFIIVRCEDNILSGSNLTANTSAALRRVRLPNEVRYIWIDAICIDQSCIKDKERQIANMGFVYSLAQRVLVWLGDNVTRDGLLTLKYIRELAMHNPTDTDSGCQLQRVFDNIREGKPSCLIDVKKAK